MSTPTATRRLPGYWILTILLVALSGLLLLVLRSDAVRDAVVREALDRVGGRVERIEGSLLGPLGLVNLALPTGGGELQILRLDADLEVYALVTGRIVLSTLTLDGVKLASTGAEPSPAGAPFAGFSSPMPLRIRRLHLTRLTLSANDGVEMHGSLRGALALDADDLVLRNLDLDLELTSPALQRADLRLLGEASVALTPELDWQLDLDLGATGPADWRWQDLEASLSASGDLHQARASMALVEPFAVRLEADGAWSPASRITASATLTAPLPAAASGIPDTRIGSARVEIDGDGTGLRLRLETELSTRDPVTGGALGLMVTAQGLLANDRFLIEAARIGGPGFDADLDGRFELDTLDFETHLRLRLADARRWLPDRALDFVASASIAGGRAADGTVQLRIPDLDLSGALDGAAVSASGALNAGIGPRGTELRGLGLDLGIGDNSVRVDGDLRPILDLRVTARLPTLTALTPDISGSAELSAALEGSVASPHGRVEAHVRDAAVGDLSIALLDITARRASAAAAAPVDLQALASGLVHPLLAVPATLAVTGSGVASAMQVTLNGATDSERVDARLDLGARTMASGDTTLSGTLTQLSLRSPRYFDWTLQAPVPVSFTTGSAALRVGAACLASAPARLCSAPIATPERSGKVEPGPPQIALTLTDLEFVRLAAWLPADLALDGVLGGEMLITGTDLIASLHTEDADFRILGMDTDDEIFSDRLRSARLNLRRTGARFSGDALLDAVTSGRASLTGEVEPDPDADFAAALLDLRADLDVADLSVFTPLLPWIDGASGRASGGFAVKGLAADPSVDGRMLIDGAGVIPLLGRELRLEALEIIGSAGDGVRFTGGLGLDATRIELSGSADYSAADGFSGSLQLMSEEAAQVVALPDLALWAKPDLDLRLRDGLLDLSGRLSIPRARIAVTSIPATGTTLSSDVVLHTAQDQRSTQALRTQGRVRLELGDDVQLSAGSLRTRLVGALDLTATRDGSVTAEGRIETRGGGISRFGRELSIKRGELAFDGPITRPLVDLTATRTIGVREVGVNVVGPPNRLETSLFSSPPADDMSTMTMLVTGREPATASSEDLDRVRSAALGLGIGAANPIFQGIGDRLGIQEFGIDTGGDTGAVVAGKRLSDKLYVRYNYALSTRSSGLQLEYRISDTLSARTETGSVHALDLLFRRQFD